MTRDLAREAHVELLAVALYRDYQLNGRSRLIKWLPQYAVQGYWRRRATRLVELMEDVAQESAASR